MRLGNQRNVRAAIAPYSSMRTQRVLYMHKYCDRVTYKDDTEIPCPDEAEFVIQSKDDLRYGNKRSYCAMHADEFIVEVVREREYED